MSHLHLKVFWAIWLQFLFLPGFPVYFFRFLSRSQRFVGQVSSFCFRRCVAYGEAMEWYYSSPRLSKSRAIRWPVMSRATEATTQDPLERSRRDPVELPTMRAKHIRTSEGEHPLDSRKRRSNFAGVWTGVSTLSVGYALWWYLNHRPNFILAKLWWFLPDSHPTASWQPLDSHLTATRKFASVHIFGNLCVK